MAEKKIGGRQFKAEPMLAMDAVILQARLFKVAGAALDRLGTILAGHGPDKSQEEKDASNAAALSAIADIFAKNDPVEVAKLLKDLVETCQIRRESGVYDTVDFDGDFTQHKGDILPVAFFAMSEQFGDFFAGLPGLGSRK